MNNQIKMKQQTENLQKFAVLNFLLISFMLSCFGFILGRLLLILTGREMQTTGFQTLTFLVSLEALLLRYFQKKDRGYSSKKIAGIIAEVIVIILFTKVYSMLLEGFSTLWIQISLWQQDFWNNFFDPNTMLYIFGTLIIWVLTWFFSSPLNKIEADHELMEQEKLGIVFTDRRKARRELINLIFSLGFLMIILTSSINYYLEIQPFYQPGTQRFLLILVLYFGSGFVFLSINQYAIMKAYWYLNDIKISSSLINRWLLYTLLFIAIIISVISFLPNDFSVNVDSLVDVLFQVLVSIFSFIEFLIIFPTVLIFTLLSALFSGEPVQDQIVDQAQEYIPTAPQIGGETQWLEVIKSIFFWLIFISIIVFAIRFYITNNLHIKSFLKNIRFAEWLKDILKWFKEGFLNIIHTASTNVEKGMDSIRTYFKDRQFKISKLADLTQKIPPRQVVINTYWEWIQWNNKTGFIRKDSQTPLEFAQNFKKFNQETSGLVNTFTDTFIAARYTNHLIGETQAQEAKVLFNKIKQTIEQVQEKQESDRDGQS